MRGKKRKKNRILLSMLLSVMLAVESIGPPVTVYAVEDEQSVVWEEQDQPTETDSDESMSNDMEDGEENIGGDTEDEIPSVNDSDQEDETSDNSDMPGEDEGQKADSDIGNEDGEQDADSEMGSGEELQDEEESADEDILAGDAEVSEEDVEDVPVEDAKEEQKQFSGMPNSYRLTSQQQAEKRLLAGKIGDIDEENEGIQYVSRQIMTFADSQSEAEMIAEAYNADIESFENGLLVMTLEEGTSVCDALQASASSGTTLPAVWPNYYRYVYGQDPIEIEETEYDAYEDTAAEDEESDIPIPESYEAAIAAYGDEYLKSGSSQYQWQHVAVGSPYAWDEGYKGGGVKVAVLDTGVRASHEDLAIAGSYNTSSSGSASDVHGHGTHVAGIIGAQLNNGKGGAGIAPDAELYCIKVIGDNGSGTDDDIIQGMIQAIELDVDVVNMSLGGPGYNGAFQDVIDQAYEKGIAIFASAGNDGISVNNYPACYDHIICVAATDEDNGRAAFSTYGSWVDISAPGLNIWSTYNKSDTSYTVMSGTSMACPVAVGEAAVILGSYDSLQGVKKNGDKVDSLEDLMKKNSVKVSGTGMGSGVPSLTKMFKLNTAAVKPAAPTIQIVPNNEAAAQLVTVTITAQSGTTIYYTTNGKTPAFKNGEPDTKSGTQLYSTDYIIIQDSAKATIKAIAVNESGVSSAVKSASYTLKPYVTAITVSGVKKVVKGRSIQLSAAVTPAYATNKKVSWELYKDGKKVDAQYARDVGVSISTGGKVTAAKNAQTGNYTVRAVAKDEGGKTGEYTISVIDSVMVGSVKFGKKSLSINLPTVTQLSLVMDADFEATLNDEAKTPASEITDIIWKSSNTSVATVDDQGIVTPLKAGKVTITALANDSSGKKAACTVTITQLATDVSITGPASVAAGRNVTFKATVMPADTKNKKVTWELYKVYEDENGEKEEVKVDAVFAKEAGVSISTGGKVTAAGNAQPGLYAVKAISQGRPSIEYEKYFNVTDGAINKLAFENSKESKVTLFRKDPATGELRGTTVKLTVRGKDDGTTPDLDAYSVTNSAPGVAAVAHSRKGNTITLTIIPTGNATGKTKITVASTDGSNKKLICNVTVVNPVSKIHIVSNTITVANSSGGVSGMRVVQGKSLQLKAVLESEYGKVSNTGVTWSADADAASGVKISSSGKVTTTTWASADKTYTVTATTKDGSGLSASYLVKVVAPATRVSLAGLKSDGLTVYKIKQFPADSAVQQFYEYQISHDVTGGYVTATSSDKQIMEVAVSDGYLLLSPRKEGTVAVTLKATDGSGIKTTYKFRITDEIYTGP